MIHHHLPLSAKTAKHLRVLLIWPPGFLKEDTLPLSLAYLKSSVDPQRHTVEILDCVLDGLQANSPELAKRIGDNFPDVVGISCFSTIFAKTLDVFSVVKTLFPSCVTILGGAHATCYPDAVLKRPEIDFVFIGEGEMAFPKFLDQVAAESPDWSVVEGLAYRDANGTIVKNGHALVEHLDTIRLPDYQAIRLIDYNNSGYQIAGIKCRSALMLATRGCPYRCTFCSAPLINGRAIRRHSHLYLMNWIRHLYD